MVPRKVPVVACPKAARLETSTCVVLASKKTRVDPSFLTEGLFLIIKILLKFELIFE
jgi:hypothetical protein